MRRPELATKLTEAVAEGDLKENANYHDAKEQLAFVEGRIQYLENILRSATIIANDGASDVVSVGTTRRGTPVLVHRGVVETDLVVATGCIRPHYFAGFGAGAKAIFPGLGERAAIRTNHLHKTHANARAGIVDGNPCREDLEEAARLVPVPTFLVNGVVGPDERIHAVITGDLERAFRAGAAMSRQWFRVTARPAPVVIASDALPVTASLYQAAKLAAAVAPVVASGGRMILVAECPDGIGPLDVVNEAIFRIGILPRLADGVTLEPVSCLDDVVVRKTLVQPLRQIHLNGGRVIVVPHASHLIVEASL